MKHLAMLACAATIILSGTFASAKEPAELLKMWGDDLVGTWVSEQKLDADLPGFGKKGDILRGEVVWTAQGGVYSGKWTGSVDGKVIDSGISVVGWDAARNGIKVQWVTRNGASATNLIKRKGDRWVGNFVLTAADGTKSSHRGSVSVDGNRLVNEQTKRMQGGQSLPDRTLVSEKVERAEDK